MDGPSIPSEGLADWWDGDAGGKFCVMPSDKGDSVIVVVRMALFEFDAHEIVERREAFPASDDTGNSGDETSV